MPKRPMAGSLQAYIKEAQAKGVKHARARAAFRLAADAQNPSPFIQVLDRHGRPRHGPRHTSVKV